MVWTHSYDALVKLVIAAILIGLLVYILDEVPETNTSVRKLLFGFGFVLAVLIYYLIGRSLGSYLYCRFTLKMNIQFREAKQLNPSLAPLDLLNHEWVPYKELLNLSQANRYPEALTLQTHWLKGKKEVLVDERKKFKANKPYIKGVKILIYLLCPVLLILAFYNYPPASYISYTYQTLFNTASYYPILNTAILYIPLAVLLLFIDKK